jgi:carbon-monoxide dehydrogenase medium subunit
MKPPPFAVVIPESVDEAVAALAEHGDEARVLAGGQSLVPLLNMRLARPSVLVDVNALPGLDTIRQNGSLELGATVRVARLERDAAVAAMAPLVADAVRHVAHPAIRTRSTVGGTIAHGDPVAELPAVLVALGGEVVAQGPDGERTIPADSFFQSYFATALAPDELVVAIRLPRVAGRRSGFAEVVRRHGDYALVGAAVSADVGDDGTIRAARVVLFGVGERPHRAGAAEQALRGQPLGAAAIAEAARAVEAELDPPGDVHASSAYRREVAAVVVRRALERAATGGGA